MDPVRLAERLASLPATASTLTDARRAAVAILLRGNEPEVLLMRRIEREGDRWSGQIGLPGGHKDENDADLVATAMRETREEVGLDLAREAELAGVLPAVQAKARGFLLPMWITPVVFVARGEPEPVPGPEAIEAFWFPLARARRGEFASTHTYLRGEEQRVLPAWRFEERVVWGLTYEILGGFLRVLD
jgi:8-oxo-dGTP pyrophosphatase MutT (NUDIX family)